LGSAETDFAFGFAFGFPWPLAFAFALALAFPLAFARPFAFAFGSGFDFAFAFARCFALAIRSDIHRMWDLGCLPTSMRGKVFCRMASSSASPSGVAGRFSLIFWEKILKQ